MREIGLKIHPMVIFLTWGFITEVFNFSIAALWLRVISHLCRNEAPIPTHFFVILTSCGDSTFGPLNCAGPLQARSFIMPHRPDHTESCAVSNTIRPTCFCTVYFSLPLWKPAVRPFLILHNFNIRLPHFLLFFRMGQTWRGWKTGWSSTPLECETSSSLPDSASTTTGYQWKRHCGWRHFYTLIKLTDFIEWSFNWQRKPYWCADVCPHGQTVNPITVGLTDALLIDFPHFRLNSFLSSIHYLKWHF